MISLKLWFFHVECAGYLLYQPQSIRDNVTLVVFRYKVREKIVEFFDFYRSFLPLVIIRREIVDIVFYIHIVIALYAIHLNLVGICIMFKLPEVQHRIMVSEGILIRSGHLEGTHVELLFRFVKAKTSKLLPRVVSGRIFCSGLLVANTVLQTQNHIVVVRRIMDIAFFCNQYVVSSTSIAVVINHEVVQDCSILIFSFCAYRVAGN